MCCSVRPNDGYKDDFLVVVLGDAGIMPAGEALQKLRREDLDVSLACVVGCDLAAGVEVDVIAGLAL